MIRAPEVQEVLCDEGYQRLLGGILQMRWAGLVEAFEDAGNKADGATLLASLADNLCSLFLPLRGILIFTKSSNLVPSFDDN